MNLLSNAVKFTQDGTINIKAWTKEPKLKHKPLYSQNILETDKSGKTDKSSLDRMGRLFIQVQDSGVGFTVDD